MSLKNIKFHLSNSIRPSIQVLSRNSFQLLISWRQISFYSLWGSMTFKNFFIPWRDQIIPFDKCHGNKVEIRKKIQYKGNSSNTKFKKSSDIKIKRESDLVEFTPFSHGIWRISLISFSRFVFSFLMAAIIKRLKIVDIPLQNTLSRL